MPELPDVEMMRKIAKKALNKKIQKVKIQKKRVLKSSPSTIRRHLKNNKLVSTYRHGKILFIEISDNYNLLLHFGMTGNLYYYNPEKEIPKYVPKHAILQLEFGNKNLTYINYRKLGKIEIVKNVKKYLEKNNIGEDALRTNLSDFKDLVNSKSSYIKSFFLDQSNISGIGNVYADEILFQTGLYPKKKTSDLDKNEVKRLYNQMERVLKKAIELGADSRDMPSTWLIKVRGEDEKCPKCGGEIKSIKTGSRRGFYCPKCQER